MCILLINRIINKIEYYIYILYIKYKKKIEIKRIKINSIELIKINFKNLLKINSIELIKINFKNL